MAMLTLETTSKFDKDIQRMEKRNMELSLIKEVVQTLLEGNPLAEKYRDHALSGNYVGFRECHILPDWSLIYTIDRKRLVLIAFRTGSHADLF